MNRDTNLEEIRDRIYKLRTAIMYNMSENAGRLPNSLVMALRVDEEARLWFVCQRPLLQQYGFKEDFPVRLHFYHKGIFYHLEVSGKAEIMEENYEGELSYDSRPKEGLMLIRMSMNTIEYTEPYGKKEKSRFELWLEKTYRWALRHVSLPHSKPVFPKNAWLHLKQ